MARPKKVKETINDRKEALKNALREINKKVPSGIQMGSELASIDRIATGISEIDNILGGGIPKGMVTTMWGSKGGGKTSLAHYIEASAQKQGLTVYHIALENLDIERAKIYGVDPEELYVGQFPIAEQSLDTIIKLTKEGLVDLILLDSLHSLSPKGEQEDKKGEKSVESDTMALLARKLSQFFRMAMDGIKRNNVAVVFIGQSRTSVGFIAIEQLTGGNALKHNSRIIMQIRRGQKADSPKKKITWEEDGKEKSKSEIIGFDCVIKLEKVQVTGCKPELTEIHLPFHFADGFNHLIETEKELEECQQLEEKNLKEE